MARRAENLGPTVVLVNPDEHGSAASSRDVIAEILASPVELSPESLHAAEILRELRDATQ